MRILSLTLMTLLIMSCSSNKKVEKTTVIELPPITIEVEQSLKPIEQITNLAAQSGVSKYIFKNRGKAPLGFIKGVALAYAQELCKPTTLPESWKNSSDTDALIYYSIEGNTSINTYGFLIGLGMRESSGTYCEGRDMSATNTSATSAEAGMFQTSYDVGATVPRLLSSFDQKCHVEIFEEGINKTKCNFKNYGTGVGADFQKKSKECPTFAVKVAADSIRLRRKHYGPINRKEVEFRPEAVELLTQVKKLIEANPSICTAL